MAETKRVLLSWSSGKDCAWALHVLRRTEGVEVVALLTTEDESRERVAMHQVRRALLEAQREAIGLPLLRVPLPSPCPNAVYEARMAAGLEEARAHGVDAVAFGDLFLEDIRAYREAKLAPTGTPGTTGAAGAPLPPHSPKPRLQPHASRMVRTTIGWSSFFALQVRFLSHLGRK